MKFIIPSIRLTLGVLLSFHVSVSSAVNCPSSSANINSIASCTVIGEHSNVALNFASGFDSSKSVEPIDGNNGITQGEQRRLAFIKAAEILANQIHSPVTIEVNARFSSLECDINSAVLGSAGASTSVAFEPSDNVVGAEIDTFYPVALANALIGFDIVTDEPDIYADFNSNLGDLSCLQDAGWYYGYADAPGFETGFLSVLLHEILHGLGFASLINPSSGAKPTDNLGNPLDDIYSNFLFDASLNDTWNDLNNSQRVNSAVGDQLFWNGSQTNTQAIGTLDSGFLDADSSGTFTSGDKIKMHAPSELALGSSVSHFDIGVSPDELMEPNLTDIGCQTGLALNVLQDLGWGVTSSSSQDFHLNIFCQSINDGDTYESFDSSSNIVINFENNETSPSYSLSYKGSDVTDDLVSPTTGGIAISLPSTGEFAGEYTLTVSNGANPDIEITIVRQLDIQFSSAALLSGVDYTLTVRGGAANSVYTLSTDPGDAITFFDNQDLPISSITAQNNAEDFNPAHSNITATPVLETTSVLTTVGSQSNTYNSVESNIEVYPSVSQSFNVIDTSGMAIGDVNVELSSNSLASDLGLELEYTTDEQGQLTVLLPDSSSNFTFIFSKTGFNDKYWYVSNLDLTHDVTLQESNTTEEEETPEENVIIEDSNKSGGSSSGFGSLSVLWLLLWGFIIYPMSIFRRNLF
ncbi:hypothetical protein NBRC116188_11910 [Oceaniserpentilla sp. 4NH20-0058]|uniref:hypothetical protein n=1 Tax=Oceaniserpentilla sp. 4NH20-0058 TaxID=3127660 RepID=UPI0031077BEA